MHTGMLLLGNADVPPARSDGRLQRIKQRRIVVPPLGRQVKVSNLAAIRPAVVLRQHPADRDTQSRCAPDDPEHAVLQVIVDVAEVLVFHMTLLLALLLHVAYTTPIVNHPKATMEG